MGKYCGLKEEIRELVRQGRVLAKDLSYTDDKRKMKDIGHFLNTYEVWYSKALGIVSQVMPNRKNDFIYLYRDEKRKEINFSTYTISDALRLVAHNQLYYGPWNSQISVNRQVDVLQSCLDVFDSKVYSIQTILQAEIFDSEIDSAKHLLKRGFLRAAGAICGVVLEKHLAEVCKNRRIELRKKSPTIADFNDALKDSAYDVVEWRKIQHLGDIRNLCDHNKDREPTKDEVEELINGTDRIIKTIF